MSCGSRGWWPPGAPIDLWGVGTDLGTSRDSPAVGGVYKLVADRLGGEAWRGTSKLSPDKATVPGMKQVWRRYEAGQMAGDVIAAEGEPQDGEPLLAPAMRAGERVNAEPLDQMRARAARQLTALPPGLRVVEPDQGDRALSGLLLDDAAFPERLTRA